MSQELASASRFSGTIEPLEPRIAPAAIVFVTDLDGDTVAVKTSKGSVAQLTAALKLSGMGLNGTIREIDFSTVPLVNGVNPFAGTDLTVSVIKQGPAGDGRVHVGYIDASATDSAMTDGIGLPLGKVKIAGDLAQIDAGVGGSVVALKSLTVQSMGSWGVATQAAGGSTTSNLIGKLGTIKVAGSVIGASFAFNAAVAGFIVAGSFLDSGISGTGDFLKLRIGAGSQNSGFEGNSIGVMEVKGSLHANVTFPKVGSLKVAGDYITGRILAVNIASILISGSIYGLDGVAESGSIVASGNAGSITVKGDLRGGNATNSGRISVAGNIGSVTIGGSIVGPTTGEDDFAPTFIPVSASTIFAGGNITTVKVGGNIAGPVLPFVQNNSVYYAVSCSSIIAAGDIASVFIGGSMIGVKGEESGTQANVRIAAAHLGSVTIMGDVTGTGPGNDLPEIFALGSANKIAIAKLTIGGSLRLASVIVGAFGSGPTNADGQFGTVVIRGDIASATLSAVNAGAGVGDNVNVTSRIASLAIGGSITGNSSIRAEHIVSVKLAGIPLKLQPGDRNDTVPMVFLPGGGSIAEFM